MKLFELFFIIVCVVEVTSKFLSLLYYLKMNNPVIVGKISDLKNKDMIQLFKDVNGLDQSICMITMLKNDSLQRSSGIIVHPDNLTLDKFYVQKVKKFMKVLLVLTTEDRRSMTTFYYCSVNHQSGLQRNTFSKSSYIFLIHQNVLHIISFHLRYMMVS